MLVNELDLGFASIHVIVNGLPVPFKVEKNIYDAYWLEDETEVHPEGSLNLVIDVLPCHLHDVIVVEYDRGKLQHDGGGYRTVNIVGEIGEFTVGMGAPCTDDYEEDLSDVKDGWSDDMNATIRMLPYELREFTEKGFIFDVVDNPVRYNDRSYRKNIFIDVAWEYTRKEYAWDIVSSITS